MVDMTKNYLLDMDGVLVYGHRPIPGAAEFISHLVENEVPFLVLTNNPIYNPADLSHTLKRVGLPVPPERIFTSAMATSMFLSAQNPGGTAFVIGEAGLTSALHHAGFVITDHEPDYVVLGETTSYNFEKFCTAIRLINDGACFIATNPDNKCPTEDGMRPACGAMAAMISAATGKMPLAIGKPNPLMMRLALNHLKVHSENTVMVGDRMDTDIIGGLQAGMETVLVLSGCTSREDVKDFPYRPTYIAESVGELIPSVVAATA